MNIVWPITARGGLMELLPYWKRHDKGPDGAAQARTGCSGLHHPTWRQIAVSDSHCGAGCVIGDIIAEFSLFAIGWTLFGIPLYAEYAGDLLLAWIFRIVFQYFAIAPMRNLSLGQGLIAAVKSDTLSILTFEIGLFA